MSLHKTAARGAWGAAILAAAFGLVLAMPGPACAQAIPQDPSMDIAEPPVQRVIQKTREFILRDEKQAVRRNTRLIHVYRVERVDGQRFWLELDDAVGTAMGWVATDQVVPLEKAVAFFTDRIRANPKDAFAHLMRATVLAARFADDRFPVPEDDNARKAAADYNEAIRLDPKVAEAYFNRGVLRRDRMEWDRALADFDEAIRLDAREPYAHYHRAVVLFATRRDGTADEAKAALDLQGWRDELSIYAVLLAHFDARRGGRRDQARSVLDEAAMKCDAAEWPYPVIKHLRGELDEAGLLAAATDDEKRTEARCYLGLEALEQDRIDAALEHFRWVKQRGNRRYPQYAISVAELDRLLARGAEGDGP